MIMGVRGTKGLSTLHKKLWRTFSEFIRLRDCITTMGKTDQGMCITCGSIKPFHLLDAGHFIGRRHMATRYDPRNVAAQCKGCNGYRSGEQYIFGQKLVEKYGTEMIEELFALKYQTRKFKNFELEELIDHYTKEIRGLRERF